MNGYESILMKLRSQYGSHFTWSWVPVLVSVMSLILQTVIFWFPNILNFMLIWWLGIIDASTILYKVSVCRDIGWKHFNFNFSWGNGTHTATLAGIIFWFFFSALFNIWHHNLEWWTIERNAEPMSMWYKKADNLMMIFFYL